MKQLISRACSALGILFILWGGFLLWRRYDPHWLVIAHAQKKESLTPAYVPAMPVGITIPSANVRLPVFPAEVKNNVWEETTAGVSYLRRSPKPGDIGNSILYGHNWPTLLGNLRTVKPGDTIQIEFDKSPAKTFIVAFVNTVSPDETYILQPTADRRITLYTCTGLFDSKRLVITAILNE